MIKLTVNDKEFQCENVDVFINYDFITEKATVKLFNGAQEILFDNETIDFDVSINVNCDETDIIKMISGNNDFETSVRIINRANKMINRELRNISKDRAVALGLYKSLCKSIFHRSHKKEQ